MSKNCMKDVAGMFGLKLNEEFKLSHPTGDALSETFIFTESGLQRTESGLFDCTDILMCMLKGVYDIENLPWKPKKDEMYFIPNIEDGEAWSTKCYWGNSYECKQRYETGMVCKTEGEAIEKAQFMLDALKEYHND